MVSFYTSSNTSIPVGRVEAYNNTNPARQIASYRQIGTTLPQSTTQMTSPQNLFANGQFNLLHPNQKSETLAQNIDLIA
jgi:hypothetical protein